MSRERLHTALDAVDQALAALDSRFGQAAHPERLVLAIDDLVREVALLDGVPGPQLRRRLAALHAPFGAAPANVPGGLEPVEPAQTCERCGRRLWDRERGPHTAETCAATVELQRWRRKPR